MVPIADQSYSGAGESDCKQIVRCSRSQPPWYELLCLGWEYSSSALHRARRSGINSTRIASMLLPKGRSAPHHSLPVRRHLGSIHRRGRRHPVLAPDRDGVVFEMVHRPPSGKRQQRIVVVSPARTPTSVHSGRRAPASRATRRGRSCRNTSNWSEPAAPCSVSSGSMTAGVPLAIVAGGVGLHGQARDLVAEAQCDVAVLSWPSRLSHPPRVSTVNSSASAGMIGRPAYGQAHRSMRPDAPVRRSPALWKRSMISSDEQANEGQRQKRRPVAEALHGEHFEGATEHQLAYGSCAAQTNHEWPPRSRSARAAAAELAAPRKKMNGHRQYQSAVGNDEVVESRTAG